MPGKVRGIGGYITTLCYIFKRQGPSTKEATYQVILIFSVDGIPSGDFGVGNVDFGDARGKEHRAEPESLPCVGRAFFRDPSISFSCFLFDSSAIDVIQYVHV